MPPCLLAQNNRGAMLSANQLRRRYIMALSLIAVLTIAAQGVMQLLLADQKFDSHLVNVAGRQRMLSQKIPTLSYHLLTTESVEANSRYRRELADALSLWERSHVGLLRSNTEMGLPGRDSSEVVRLFELIQPHLEAIVATAKSIWSPSGSALTLAPKIEDLKAANDGFGHAEGDWLISMAAKVLTGGIRSSDAAARLGGDEFLLILHDCSLDEGSRLLGRAETRPQGIAAAERKAFAIGFSYGLTIFTPEKDATPDDLISEADSRMYRAKQEKKRLCPVS